VTCLRSVLMKPEQLDWVDRIWQILIAAVEVSLADAKKGVPERIGSSD